MLSFKQFFLQELVLSRFRDENGETVIGQDDVMTVKGKASRALAGKRYKVNKTKPKKPKKIKKH